MKTISTYYRIFLLKTGIPFAFTNGAKQRIQKKIRMLLKDLDIITTP